MHLVPSGYQQSFQASLVVISMKCDFVHTELQAIRLLSISFFLLYINRTGVPKSFCCFNKNKINLVQEGEPLITERVWDAIVKAFASQMKTTFTASSFVKEIFTLGYPRLFSMVENLLERISRDTDVKGTLPALTPEGKDHMISAIEMFQTAFLALCHSRLSDYVNSIFPMSNRGTIPSKDQISRLVSRIQEEIEVVRTHGHLLVLVLREIGKTLLLLAQRAEYQVSICYL